MRAMTKRWKAPLLAALVIALAAGSAWCAVTGAVTGLVLDDETGAPLSGANVSISGTPLQTVTDEQGRFVITNVPPGAQALRVSLIGYSEAEVVDLNVVQGQATPVTIALKPTVVEAVGAEVKITAPRIVLKPETTATVYVVTPAEEQMVLSQPNDRYQFPGLIFGQPGVVPDNTFYPHIRGARANQVGYFLDGIPITEPNANVFATNIVSIGLDRLELFTGGYPAEYGGFVGGIVNEVVKRGDQVRGGLVDVSAGSPYDFGGLYLETGDVEDKLDYYYGQYNWHTDFPENLFTSSAPIVSDHIAKVVYDAGNRDSVTVLAAHGYARYLLPWERMLTFNPETTEWEPVLRPGSDFGRQGHDIVAATLNHTVSPQSYWTFRLSRVSHFLQLELGDLDNAYWQNRNERMLTGQLDYEAQLGDHRLRAGLWQIQGDNNSEYSVMFFPAGFVSNNDTANTQAYVTDTWNVNDRLVLTLGGRLDRMQYDRPSAGDLKLEETSGRAGLTYRLSDRAMLRGSYGQYVEFPRANLIAYEVAGLDIGWSDFLAPSFPAGGEVDRGRDLGLAWKLDTSTLLDATYFERDSRHMTQRWQGVLHDEFGNWILDDQDNPILSDSLSDFDPMAPAWFAPNGTGTTKGLELKLDRKMSDSLRGWISYTYLSAKATSPRDNIYPYGYGFLDRTDPEGLAEEFPVDWNQRDTATLAMEYRTGKLTLNPWVTYGSGFPYGQSGLDAGGSDPAHVPNPDFDPDDPSSPEELTVPQNYLDPDDPSAGFISPNSLGTGKNLTVSLNLSYRIGPERDAYFQIFNLFDREDVTSYVIYHPQTGAIIGEVQGDQVSYVPFSRTPPRFFAFGIRQAF